MRSSTDGAAAPGADSDRDAERTRRSRSWSKSVPETSLDRCPHGEPEWKVGLMSRRSGPWGYRLAKTMLTGPLSCAYDIEVDGVSNVPYGPVILAANHRSFMDSVFLALVMDRPVSFLAKAEYFDRPITRWMFQSTGQIPIRRGSPAGARKALDAARDVLSQGGAVGVYPEGTRSRDGMLHRGHLGPARLAASSGAPLVPVGILGTDQVQPPGQQFPEVGKRVAVRFGTPLEVDRPATDASGHLRQTTNRMMTQIAELSGQVYNDRFATTAPT